MRLHFTIRDLLWLVVVVALAVGWWINNSRLTSQLLAQHQRADDLERTNQILEMMQIINRDKAAPATPASAEKAEDPQMR